MFAMDNHETFQLATQAMLRQPDAKVFMIGTNVERATHATLVYYDLSCSELNVSLVTTQITSTFRYSFEFLATVDNLIHTNKF